MVAKTIDPQTIGERLRTLRGTRTQKEVGDAVGVTPMAISQYERGERVPSDNIKMTLARYFNTTVDAIFFYFLSNHFDYSKGGHTWEERTDSASRSPSSAARPAPICNLSERATTSVTPAAATMAVRPL